jgi:hypothetical protein
VGHTKGQNGAWFSYSCTIGVYGIHVPSLLASEVSTNIISSDMLSYDVILGCGSDIAALITECLKPNTAKEHVWQWIPGSFQMHNKLANESKRSTFVVRTIYTDEKNVKWTSWELYCRDSICLTHAVARCCYVIMVYLISRFENENYQ